MPLGVWLVYQAKKRKYIRLHEPYQEKAPSYKAFVVATFKERILYWAGVGCVLGSLFILIFRDNSPLSWIALLPTVLLFNYLRKPSKP